MNDKEGMKEKLEQIKKNGDVNWHVRVKMIKKEFKSQDDDENS
jgi:hypothetical protein